MKTATVYGQPFVGLAFEPIFDRERGWTEFRPLGEWMMKVRCTKLLDGMGRPVEKSPWAKIGSVYHVLEISMGPGAIRLRLVGEEPTPALFEPEMFEVVSSVIPPTWVVTIPKAGGLSLAPEPWNATGFWERFFDAEPEAVAIFEDERAKIVAADP